MHDSFPFGPVVALPLLRQERYFPLGDQLIRQVLEHIGLLAPELEFPVPLAQLKAVLRDAPLTLLALSPQPLSQMQIALACRRADWRIERGDVVGFNSELRLTAHPFLPFRQVRLSFDIPREEACSARW